MSSVRNIYMDSYGDVLNDILDLPKDDRIDNVLKELVETNDGNGIELQDKPINSTAEMMEEEKKKDKKKSSKKTSTKSKSKKKSSDGLKHIKLRRIK